MHERSCFISVTLPKNILPLDDTQTIYIFIVIAVLNDIDVSIEKGRKDSD